MANHLKCYVCDEPVHALDNDNGKHYLCKEVEDGVQRDSAGDSTEETEGSDVGQAESGGAD